MKRRTYIANITRINADGTMKEISFTTKYAWNSAIRATEALMREYARESEAIFNGERPRVVGVDVNRQYLRTWKGTNGETVESSVWEVL